LKYTILILLTILITVIYSCEKNNEFVDNNDNDNQDIDSNLYNSEWSDPIIKEINSFTCKAHKNTFIIGGYYIYELLESNNAHTILFQGGMYFTGLHVISDQEIIAVGLDGIVFKTINGGLDWHSINPGTSNDLYKCYFFNINKGFVIGNNSFIKKTTDGGNSWQDVSITFNYFIKDIIFTNDSTGFIGCGGEYAGNGYIWNSGHIYKTNNSGLSWEHKLYTNTVVTSINFPNEKIGFAVTVTGDAYKSINYGETWNKIIDSDSTTYGFKSVNFINNEIGFIVGADWQRGDISQDRALILKTIDSGDTWSFDYNEFLNGYTFNDIAFNGNKGLAITGNHIILCTLY